MEFSHTSEPDFHIERKKKMLSLYKEEITSLYGHNSRTFIFALACTFIQISLSIYLANKSFFLILLVSYILGACLNHALYVFIHEATHNLVFKKTLANKIFAIFCDTALIFPGAMAFRKYHHLHHNHMGVYMKDADLCSQGEAKMVGNSSFRKLIWSFFLGVSQALRPLRFKEKKFYTNWIVYNFIYQVLVTSLLAYLFGPFCILYLLLSTLFGLGLHPLGGRWIAEHYLTKETRQETYSYYGPVNKFMFNIGYHTEHHDFMNIPWNNLPKLRKIAPQYYNELEFHSSYLKLLIDFILNKKNTLYSRVTRD